MGEKSYVSMEQKMCLVTGKPYDSGAILLDKRLKASMERNTITGWGFCPEVQEKIDAGYVALVGVDMEKSVVKNDRIMPEDAYRTGKIAYLRRTVLENIMPGFSSNLDMTFVDEGFMKILEKMEANAK